MANERQRANEELKKFSDELRKSTEVSRTATRVERQENKEKRRGAAQAGGAGGGGGADFASTLAAITFGLGVLQDSLAGLNRIVPGLGSSLSQLTANVRTGLQQGAVTQSTAQAAQQILGPFVAAGQQPSAASRQGIVAGLAAREARLQSLRNDLTSTARIAANEAIARQALGDGLRPDQARKLMEANGRGGQ